MNARLPTPTLFPGIPPGWKPTAAPVAVPQFGRLDEYCGAWLVEPGRFRTQWELVQRLDFASHMQAAPPGRISSLEMAPGKGGQSVAVIKAAGLLMKQQTSL